MADAAQQAKPRRRWRDLAQNYQMLTMHAVDRLLAVQRVVTEMHDESDHPGDVLECDLPWCREFLRALDG